MFCNFTNTNTFIMKLLTSWILAVFTLTNYAQQVSLMQPALINAEKKLDSVNIICLDIVKNGNTVEQKTETWEVLESDSNNNPTKLMIYYYEYSYGEEIHDSIKVTLEHHQNDHYITDFRSSLLGGYKDWVYPQSVTGIYDMFNLKSIAEKTYNTSTNEWIPFYYIEGLSDVRLPGANDISRTSYYYDSNQNLTDIYKYESFSDGKKYISEKIIYDWSVQNGFTPNYKFVYYNTYNSDDEIIEIIENKVEDISSGVEIPKTKYDFTYSSTLYEYITSNWNDTTNEWNWMYKKSIEYDTDGIPIDQLTYYWSYDQWVAYEDYMNLYFLDSLYTGYTLNIPVTVDEDFSIYYNNENLVQRTVLNSVMSPPPMSSGYYEEREFYYSSAIGVEDEAYKNSLILYPNPTSSILNINLDTKFAYRIYSQHGTLLNKGTCLKTINVGHLSSGLYCLEIQNCDKMQYFKFIVE